MTGGNPIKSVYQTSYVHMKIVVVWYSYVLAKLPGGQNHPTEVQFD